MSYTTYEVTVYNDGDTFWYLNRKLHREDGPAAEYSNGDRKWYLNGLKHRESGPAAEYADGSKYWYLEGLRHRIDGPAVEWGNGTLFWYLEGKEYTEAEWKAKLNLDPCEGKTVTIDGVVYTLNRSKE